MYVLSPRDIATGEPVDWDNVGPCQNLGKVPDVSLIEPGDVILFAPLRPAAHQKLIKWVQSLASQSSSEWTHAAIAFDKDRIVEAITRNGVCCGSLFDSCADYKIKIRRPTNLSPIERMRFAMEAMSNISKSYSLLRALSIFTKRTMGIPGPLPSEGNDMFTACFQCILRCYKQEVSPRNKGGRGHSRSSCPHPLP